MVLHRTFRCNFAGCGKEFGTKLHLARHCQQLHSTNGTAIRSDSPRPIMKTRAAFLAKTTQLAKVARFQLPNLVRLKMLSKNPFASINSTQIKQECKCVLI